MGKEQEGVLKWWGKVLCSGSICAFLGLVLGQALLVLIAQGTLVLLLHLYPILPSKPTFIVCNITHNHVIYTHRQTDTEKTRHSRGLSRFTNTLSDVETQI